jgi:hypothetical protein
MAASGSCWSTSKERRERLEQKQQQQEQQRAKRRRIFTFNLLDGHNVLLSAASQDWVNNKALKEDTVATPVDHPADTDLRSQVSEEQETGKGLFHGGVHEGAALHLEVSDIKV